MPKDTDMVRVLYRDDKGRHKTYMGREAAGRLVDFRCAVWNPAESAITLIRELHRPIPRAESLTIGKRVMDKAAIEDNAYYQMLAEAYRCSPDDHKDNKTRV